MYREGINGKAMENRYRPLLYTVLISMLLLFGCEQQTINEALLIEQDTQLTCSESATDRCALPSELQQLADEIITSSDASDPNHYISILDIGEDSLLARIHLIRAATESIVLQTFIWDDDEVGQIMYMELLKAARRGVKVRMILDQFGCYLSAKVMAAMDTAHKNIEIKLYRPILNQGSKSVTQDIGNAITDSVTLYRRMHNKLFAVDERIGIVGGRNIQDSYYDYGNKVNFKDLDLLVVGPVVKDMYQSFEFYWNSKDTKGARELDDIASAALNLKESDYLDFFDDSREFEELRRVSEQADFYSIVQERDTLELYPVDRIEYIADWPDDWEGTEKVEEWDTTTRLDEIVAQAEHSIRAETPYLIQNSEGIRILKAFRKEKPDVEISLCTNSLASADMFFVWAIIFKQRQLYIEILDCRMYELRPVPGDVLTMMPRFTRITEDPGDETDLNEGPKQIVRLKYTGPRLCLHSKFFVVDERISAVGSHNFDPRASNLNTENMLIVWDEQVSRALSSIFERDTAPQNAWVIARRKKLAIVGNVSELIARISSALPVFDIWPFDYSSNFDLKENKKPVSPDHPDFYKNYNHVGVFPEVKSLSYMLGVRFIKAFGGIARGLM